ncbi:MULTISPECIES: sensor histidine kinase [unclassified Janthinobacterium]|uniref:sensor histidine kinase n=1 Tax=unclassified Janthinobacterium TaxID=2610881 RepID=UPI0016114C0C|nr:MULTISPECIES: sensor histidine kinase [unclassified Janthinobacterium]MBB5368369.1 signal transduction histidine kinase [Janthinobacterium sp. K2C7]MBB5382095.1 signal transduction histidine kinase [Janthinobacterium sp. K2Li3]MBB5386751.1 signal transduction histidine kinase [Janthinobacterium sp. K2E3]
MMQWTAQLSNRLCLFACASTAGLAFATVAGQADDAEAPWPASDADLFNLVTVCAILLGLLTLLLLWRQRQLRNSSAQALLATHGRLRQLNSEHQQVREEERRRIGRDIHDDLGQHLLTLKMDLAMLQKNAHGAYPLLARQLALMVQNVDLSIASLRSVIDDLRPPALTQGLSAACGALLEEFSRVNDIGYDYALGYDDGTQAEAIAGPHDALLYRVLQETLANIARHAQATHIKVRLERPGADGAVHLDIMDDGIGMPALPRQGGCGLAGMRERLAAADGTLEIASQAGGGTRIHLTLPLST